MEMIPNLLKLLEFPDLLDIPCPHATSSPCKFSPDDSGTSGLYLSLQVLQGKNPEEHPFAILENSTLRRDWNFFFFFLRQVSLSTQSVDLRLCVSPDFRSNRIVCR